MPKLKLRKYITEGFADHLKNNYGKYLAGTLGGMVTGGVLGDIAGGMVDGVGIAQEHPNYSREQIEAEIKRRVSNGNAYLLDGLQYGIAGGGILGGLYGFNKANQKKTISENTMQIEIKKASPEVIVEAVHANHPNLDKRIITNGEKLYGTGFRKNGSNEHMAYNGGTVSENRAELANSIRETRKLRDEARANITGNQNMTGESSWVHDNKMYDNLARAKSRFGLSDLGAQGGKIPADILMNSVVKTNPSAQTNLSEFQRKPDSWKLYSHGLISRNISSAKQ